MNDADATKASKSGRFLTSEVFKICSLFRDDLMVPDGTLTI